MTVSKPPSDAAALRLPRILCLHGGGVNARVFEMQSRSIVAHLWPAFRLVFVDGPYASAPHPDIVAVYGQYGPFRAWIPSPNSRHAIAGDNEAIVARTILTAMRKDPGSGEWVGVMGFSQGAKIAASLLWAQEAAIRRRHQALTNFKFGIIMAGRGPLVQLDPRAPSTPYVCDAAFMGVPEDYPEADVITGDHIISSIPTVHVHGLDDPGLDHHRLLLDRYFDPKTTRLVEWYGSHRLPIKSKDVLAMIDGLGKALKDGKTKYN